MYSTCISGLPGMIIKVIAVIKVYEYVSDMYVVGETVKDFAF